MVSTGFDHFLERGIARVADVTFRNLGVVLSKIVSLVLSPDCDINFELVVKTDVQSRETDSASTGVDQDGTPGFEIYGL
jgi:hypothetical protein